MPNFNGKAKVRTKEISKPKPSTNSIFRPLANTCYIIRKKDTG
jgi:hypothetical protein